MSSSVDSSASSRLFNLLGAALILAALYFAKEILLPFALAVLLCFLLTPLVRRIERWGTHRIVSVLLVVSLAFVVIGSVGWLVTDQMIQLSGNLPDYKGNLIDKIRSFHGMTRGRLEEASDTIAEISQELTEEPSSATTESDGPTTSDAADAKDGNNENEPLLQQLAAELTNRLQQQDDVEKRARERAEEEAMRVKVVSLPPSPLEQVTSWLGPLVAPLTTAGVVIVLTLFMLIQREDLRDRVLQLIGTKHLRTTTEALDDATARVSRFLRTQLAINASYGLFVGIGLHFIGVPNAILWGVLGCLLRFLPYLGPWLVAAMPITLSMAVFHEWSPVIWTVGLFIVLELVVNNVMEPLFYGASMGVSSVGIIVSAIFWTWLWGPIGLVLAMPLTVCMVVMGNYVPEMKFVTILLGDRPSLSIYERFYQRLLAFDDDEAATITQQYLRDHTVLEWLDGVLLPALMLAERDRHRGNLAEDRRAFVMEVTRDLVDEHAGIADTDQVPGNNDPASCRVLCVPARDEADEMAAQLFAYHLRQNGFEVELRTTAVLVGELVEQAKRTSFDALVVSAVPPAATRHTRYLCKRFGATQPEVPIFVGLWAGDHFHSVRKSLEQQDGTHVVTKFSQALEKLQAIAAARRATDVRLLEQRRNVRIDNAPVGDYRTNDTSHG